MGLYTQPWCVYYPYDPTLNTSTDLRLENMGVETEWPAPMLEESAMPLLGDNGSVLDELLSMLPSPVPPFSPIRADPDMGMFGEASSCNCSISHQALLKRLDVATKQPEVMSLDRILQALKDTATHISKSSTCTHCDSGCSRLMSLAFLHQRQAGLICTMTNNAAMYLSGSGANAVRFTLGIFQLTAQEDLDHKRLLILSAARRIDSQVAEFDDAIRYQNMEVMGSQLADTLEQSESAKLNLRWLLDVAMNLKGRLKIILSILEKPDWVSGTENVIEL